MRKLILILSFMAFVVLAGGRFTNRITENTRMVNVDTLFLAGTDTAYTTIFWQPKGEYKSYLFEASDSAHAGFADDSACARIHLLQGFDIGIKQMAVMNSRAHPDSTTYPYGSEFLLFDSLHVADMDTLALWDRRPSYRTDASGDTTHTWYNDTLDALSATQTGGFEYMMVSPDYSPGTILRLIGLGSNQTREDGSRWIIRTYQQTGTPVYNK